MYEAVKNSALPLTFLLTRLLYRLIHWAVPKKQTQPRLRAWRPTIEDEKLMQELQKKLGINEPALLRMGLRKLAEHEGLNR